MSAQPAYLHASVMTAEVLDHLAPRPGGVYCDATLGGGGHAEAILLRSAPDGRVVGVDRDPAALAAATARLAPFGARFLPLRGRFADLRALLAEAGVAALDGLVADVGVSSAQLDQPARGFSFQRSGPLDMRMDPDDPEDAAALIDRLDEEALADVLFQLGEERRSRPIARAIKRAAAEGALTDTAALARVVAAAAGGRRGPHDPATRTFQALRIAVNDELRQLDRLLLAAPGCLRPGGRLAIIAFHSLEDRIVKRRLRELSAAGVSAPLLSLRTRRPVEPTDEEVARNPRARSARLRAAERLPDAQHQGRAAAAAEGLPP